MGLDCPAKGFGRVFYFLNDTPLGYLPPDLNPFI